MPLFQVTHIEESKARKRDFSSPHLRPQLQVIDTLQISKIPEIRENIQTVSVPLYPMPIVGHYGKFTQDLSTVTNETNAK